MRLKNISNFFIVCVMIFITTSYAREHDSQKANQSTSAKSDSEYWGKFYNDAAKEKLDRLCGDDIDCRMRLFNEETERMKAALK